MEELGPETDEKAHSNEFKADVMKYSSLERKYSMERTEQERSTLVGGFELWQGQKLDVLDGHGRWSEADVLKVDVEEMRAFITYTYYSSEWDEAVPFSDFSRRVAKRHTHTYTEGGEFKKGQRVELREDLSDPSSRWREAFVEGVLPTTVALRIRNEKEVRWVPKDLHHIRRFGLSKDLTRKVFNKRWNVPGAPSSSSQSRKREILAATVEFSHYQNALASLNLRIMEIPGDGNCLFRAVAHQVYGDDSFHVLVREKCCDYMASDKLFFSNFVVGGLDFFEQYLRAKRTNSCWGDDPEIQAMCELYNRPAEIWAFDHNSGARKLRTFHSGDGASSSSSSSSSSVRASDRNSGGTPMRLSFYGGGHYDSIVSPDFERALLSKSAPGVVEDASIVRRTNIGTDIDRAELASDAAATEAATVEAVLQNSREEVSGWGDGGGDLEACLALSLKDYDAGLNRAADSKNGKGELVDIQDEMLRSVEELSEKEYVDQAMAASMMDFGKPGGDIDAGFSGTMAPNMSEEEALELAIQQSMRNTGVVQPMTAASGEFLINDEEDDLQKALLASATYK